MQYIVMILLYYVTAFPSGSDARTAASSLAVTNPVAPRSLSFNSSKSVLCSGVSGLAAGGGGKPGWGVEDDGWSCSGELGGVLGSEGLSSASRAALCCFSASSFILKSKLTSVAVLALILDPESQTCDSFLLYWGQSDPQVLCNKEVKTLNFSYIFQTEV